MEYLLKPARMATSRPAQRTYLNTILLLITSTILLGVAIVSYWFFYFNYIPQIGIERVIHLQYGDGPHPYGIAKLDSSLISQQPYDIALSLNLPLSPPNLAQGNFMLSLDLLRASYTPPPTTTSHLDFKSAAAQILHQSPSSLTKAEDVIHTSRRPALLTYTSRLVSLSSRLAALPLYLLNLRQESETLLIPMYERLSFPRGNKNNIPEYIMLTIQASSEPRQTVQIYDVRVKFTARFGGIRWLMYNWKFTSFVVFTGVFWGVEVVGLVVSWLVLKTWFSAGGEEDDGKRIKEDEDTERDTVKNETDDPELSDTPRTFPTYGKQKPLRYEPKIKTEEGSDVYVSEEVPMVGNVEADDEDDGEEDGEGGAARDSGLGTSFDESGGRGVRRRRSRGGRGGGGK